MLHKRLPVRDKIADGANLIKPSTFMVKIKGGEQTRCLLVDLGHVPPMFRKAKGSIITADKHISAGGSALLGMMKNGSGVNTFPHSWHLTTDPSL